MTITSSGVISINSLVGEYGGSAPHAMNEYYRGGSLVANHSNNGNVPTSGTIDLQDFYGANNTSPSDYTVEITNGSHTVDGGKFAADTIYRGVNTTTRRSGTAFGSFANSNNTITTGEGTFTITALYTVHSTGVAIVAYVNLSGNQGGGSFESVIGSGSADWRFKIGSTTYLTDGGNAGSYNASSGDTEYQWTQNNTIAASGTNTWTLADS